MLQRPKMCKNKPPRPPPVIPPFSVCQTKFPTQATGLLWNNGGAVVADDANEAEFTKIKDECSQFLRGWDFNFIFDAIYINVIGIRVFANVRKDGDGLMDSHDAELSTTNGLSKIIGSDTKNITTVLTPTLQTIEWGGDAETWNAGLTVAQAESLTFGVRCRFCETDAENTDALVNFLQCKVCVSR